MTLFTLLIVMALERISVKSKRFHITTLANQYFAFLNKKRIVKNNNSIIVAVLVAGVPAAIAFALVILLPGLFVFALYLFALWVCLGCPVTRQTYKRYLQAADRGDFEACSLYSESFGNNGGALSEVGKQLVLVNYRQYASVIIFFVLLGLPGMVFYSIAKEWHFSTLSTGDGDSASTDNAQPSKAKRLLNILDFIPARITAFGFLLVGHFSSGLGKWLETALSIKIDAYDLLASVAKASESIPSNDKPYLNEALQMVNLVKRNIVFLLMTISVMTLVGLVA